VNISHEKLTAQAEVTGFRPDVLEKVVHLLGLLEALGSHPSLKSKLALKGGTALNLFVFKVPRLSVDIDLNYVGAENREAMIAERPKIEQAAQAVFAREGFTVRRMPEANGPCVTKVLPAWAAISKWTLTLCSGSLCGRSRYPILIRLVPGRLHKYR